MNFQRRQSAPETVLTVEIPGLRDHLSRSDLFSSCTREVQDALLGHFHFRHFNNGEYLIQSGSKALTIFILLKGKIQIVSDKYESVLAELGPGMMFGEIGALFGVPRIASAITRSSGLVAVIDKNTLQKVIGNDRVLWNHLKGIALSRYRSSTTIQSTKCPHVLAIEKESFLSSVTSFKELPPDILKRLSELAEVTEYKAEFIIDFFSPRTKHVLYILMEGTLQANYLTGISKTLHPGESFKSYDNSLDFVKTLTDNTIVMIIDVQDVSVILASDPDSCVQELGEKILGVTHLTDNIDANSSITSAASKHLLEDLNSLVNPSQFSRKRRNSAPIFSDLGKQNGTKFFSSGQSILLDVSPTTNKLIKDDSDLKSLLMNAGVMIHNENVTLFHDSRLNLNSIRNELTDSILLLIVSMLGSHLKVLNLTDCHLLTNSGILAIWLRCPELTKVSLQGCWNLDDSSFSTLSRCPCAETLKEINVSHCWRMTSKVINFLGPNVTKLDFSYCKGLDDRTWPALTQFSHTLRSLKLRRCYGITDNSFEGLFGIQFNELDHLDLSECSFLTDSAVSTIISSATNIRYLNLSFASGIKGSFLLAHASLPNLRVLNLSHLKDVVIDTFCIRLARVCYNLEELYLDGCDLVDDDVIDHFINEYLPELRVLSVNDCPLISQTNLDLIKLKYEK